ncbi:MAG: P1 family peptidase [Clostridiales bacterium]|nr:P1 family peptidase [Clostridiales bacterium]
MDEILLPDGIKIGHAQDDYTGVTCILTERAVGGVSVRGGAPGTRETDMLRADKSQGHVDAIVLSGGSAYGLEAACGVVEYLKGKGVGFAVGDKVVPLVAQAILFDLNTPGEYHYPDKNMGYLAAKNAKAHGVAFGNVGAGRGATVGKILGPACMSKSGIGAATLKFNDVFVTAVVAVNALGDVYDHRTGKILAGAKGPDGSFINTVECLTGGIFAAQAAAAMQKASGTNTTIGCVMTNAKLDKAHVNKLAAVAHDGLAMSIRPVHTDADGDTMFALSGGDKVIDYSIVAALAAEATAFAIENSVGQGT